MKFIALLVISFTLITSGCASKPPASAPSSSPTPAPSSSPAPDPSSSPAPDPSSSPAPALVEPMAPGFVDLDTAIREASNYLNDNVPLGSMIVILNIQSVSEALSDYVIDGLIANAVNDRVFTAVDRQQLDLIRAEHNFQMSGSVDDKNAVSIGKFIGAQTIVSGRVRKLGDYYRMTIRALDVETAQVQGQYNRNNITGKTITDLMEKSGDGKEIKNSLAAVKAANEGDFITMNSGEPYVLTYDEIDIARGEFNFNDLSGVPGQIEADGTEIKNISESHKVKVFPDNQSAHLIRAPSRFIDYMKYVEENYYLGQYRDERGSYHDSKPESPPVTYFRAIVHIQKISDGESEYERLIITAYNFRGNSSTRRYYPTDDWIWGYVSGTFRPVGEPIILEF
jgi:TolB-like protein